MYVKGRVILAATTRLNCRVSQKPVFVRKETKRNKKDDYTIGANLKGLEKQTQMSNITIKESIKNAQAFRKEKKMKQHF